jgi:hypothetical protein
LGVQPVIVQFVHSHCPVFKLQVHFSHLMVHSWAANTGAAAIARAASTIRAFAWDTTNRFVAENMISSPWQG